MTDLELTKRVETALCLAYCQHSKSGAVLSHAPVCKRFTRWRIVQFRTRVLPRKRYPRAANRVAGAISEDQTHE